MTGRLASRLRRLERAQPSTEPIVLCIQYVTPEGEVAEMRWVRHWSSWRMVEQSDDGEHWLRTDGRASKRPEPSCT